MNKICVFILFILIITPIVLSAAAPQISSTPLPSPSVEPCTGEAKVIFKAQREKTLGEEDTPSKIAENLKSSMLEIQMKPEFSGFFSCTYPPSFYCPTDKCKVLFESAVSLGIIPNNANLDVSHPIEYDIPGKTKKSYNWLQIIAAGINLGNIDFSNIDSEQSTQIADLIIPDIMAELEKIKEEVLKKGWFCPEGYAGLTTIAITSFNPYWSYNGYNVEVGYNVHIKCVKKTGATTAAYLNTVLVSQKRCIPK